MNIDNIFEIRRNSKSSELKATVKN